MHTESALEQGREAFQQQAWGEAYTLLSAADTKASLKPKDLRKLAESAYLISKEADFIDILKRTHQIFLDKGDAVQAANCAFWLGITLFNQGNQAQGGGWIGRAQHLIDGCGQKSVEQGLLLVPQALQRLREGDAEG